MDRQAVEAVDQERRIDDGGEAAGSVAVVVGVDHRGDRPVHRHRHPLARRRPTGRPRRRARPGRSGRRRGTTRGRRSRPPVGARRRAGRRSAARARPPTSGPGPRPGSAESTPRANTSSRSAASGSGSSRSKVAKDEPATWTKNRSGSGEAAGVRASPSTVQGRSMPRRSAMVGSTSMVWAGRSLTSPVGLSRGLDEQRDPEQLGLRGLVDGLDPEPPHRPAGLEGDAVVGGDDDEGVVVEPGPAEPVEHVAQQAVDLGHLELEALAVEPGRRLGRRPGGRRRARRPPSARSCGGSGRRRSGGRRAGPGRACAAPAGAGSGPSGPRRPGCPAGSG